MTRNGNNIDLIRCLTLALLISACDAPDERLFAGIDRPAAEAVPTASDDLLEYVRSIGSADGDLAFGSIVSVAQHSDSILAIADRLDCSVSLVDLRDLSLINRLGRCGEGPAEFGSIANISFRGDSLMVFDARTNTMVALTIEGEELWRERIAGIPLNRTRTAWPLGDGNYLLANVLPPTLGEIVPDSQSALVSLVGSQGPLDRGVLDSPFSVANTSNLAREVPTCAHPTRANTFAVLNRWAFQGLIATAEPFAVETNFFRDFDWLAPQLRDNGGYTPNGISMVACSEDFALFKYIQFDMEEARRIVGGALELRSWDGMHLGTMTLTQDDSLLFGWPHGGLGQSLYIATSSLLGYPAVLEFQLSDTADW